MVMCIYLFVDKGANCVASEIVFPAMFPQEVLRHTLLSFWAKIKWIKKVMELDNSKLAKICRSFKLRLSKKRFRIKIK